MTPAPYTYVPIAVLRCLAEKAREQAEAVKGTDFDVLVQHLEHQAWIYQEAIHQQEEAVHLSNSASRTERRRWAIR